MTTIVQPVTKEKDLRSVLRIRCQYTNTAPTYPHNSYNEPSRRQLRSVFKALFCISSLLALQSCVNSNIEILESITEETVSLPPGEGLLIVQVADTTPTAMFYPANQITLAAKDTNQEEDKLPRLVSIESVGSSTTLFAGSLPANEYSLTSLRAFYQFGESYFSRFYPAGIELGTFRIEANKTTDLGLLGVYIERTGDDYRYATTRFTANDRGIKQLLASNPELLANVYSNQDVLTWQEDGKSTERQNQYRHAVNRQNVFGVPQIDEDDGTILYPSRAGVVVNRTAEGEWLLDAFTDDVELRQATKLGDRLFVVTEFNSIHSREAGQQQWQEHSGPDTDGNIVHIGQQPNGSAYAVLKHDQSFSIWTADNFSGPWLEKSRIDRIVGFLEKVNNFGATPNNENAPILDNGQFLFASFGTGLYRYEFATEKSIKLRDSRLGSMQIRNQAITTNTDGNFFISEVSFDNGDNWTKTRGYFLENEDKEDKFYRKKTASQRNTFPKVKFIGHPIFTSNTTGYAIHPSLRKSGEPFLIYTENTGSIWKKAGNELPEGCANLVLASETSLLLRCFLSGEFYNSTDGGESWNLEREVSET